MTGSSIRPVTLLEWEKREAYGHEDMVHTRGHTAQPNMATFNNTISPTSSILPQVSVLEFFLPGSTSIITTMHYLNTVQGSEDFEDIVWKLHRNSFEKSATKSLNIPSSKSRRRGPRSDAESPEALTSQAVSEMPDPHQLAASNMDSVPRVHGLATEGARKRKAPDDPPAGKHALSSGVRQTPALSRASYLSRPTLNCAFPTYSRGAPQYPGAVISALPGLEGTGDNGRLDAEYGALRTHVMDLKPHTTYLNYYRFSLMD
ncbi:hypothetical protein B0T26DRAFT_700250 [Lasiosphaeria miniovina]|uniref:Uncharacterized protein n=1 Tax=Lasiosphaeria miniovina TaxID=1954250 RepID=A0AA40ATR9_9PEZI|nr:uncharacterized protein B0T26DRAFT_700250 [Lasiosphaeria miniovina]KAK0721767.1 hypothetical protein B0T26DRAFT_700250 [Lasiosphaeria miniovina]